MARKRRTSFRPCLIYGCMKQRVVLARCVAHFRQLDPEEVARLKSLCPAELKKALTKQTEPAPPEVRLKWEYEVSPEQVEECIRLYGGQS